MIKLKVTLFTSFHDRLLGLIRHDKPQTIMFLTRFGIHTLGLKYPVDVIVLDKNNKVVKIRKRLKPNRFYVWPIKYNKVIELPAGQIKKLGIEFESKIRLLVVK